MFMRTRPAVILSVRFVTFFTQPKVGSFDILDARHPLPDRCLLESVENYNASSLAREFSLFGDIDNARQGFGFSIFKAQLGQESNIA